MNSKLFFILINLIFLGTAMSQVDIDCEVPKSLRKKYRQLPVVDEYGKFKDINGKPLTFDSPIKNKSFVYGDIIYPMCIGDRISQKVIFNDFIAKIEPDSENSSRSKNKIPITVDEEKRWGNYAYTYKRWKQLNIPYYIDLDTFLPANFNELEEDEMEKHLNEISLRLSDVKNAFKVIENATLIKFIEIPQDQYCEHEGLEGCDKENIYHKKFDVFTPETERNSFIYVRWDTSGFCRAYVGREVNSNWQATRVTMSPRCSFGGYIHEVLHALGRMHEQSRYDRDKYMEVDWTDKVHVDLKDYPGQYRRLSLPEDYLEYYGLVNPNSSYLPIGTTHLKQLSSLNADETILDLTNVFKYDPYFLWGSMFSFQSTMLYNNAILPRDENQIAKRVLPPLQNRKEILKIDQFKELTSLEKGDLRASMLTLERGDTGRLNFLMNYGYLKNKFFKHEKWFKEKPTLPKPVYVQFNWEKGKGYIRLPLELREKESLAGYGIYINFRRGNLYPIDLNPMYGGSLFIPLWHYLDGRKLFNLTNTIEFDVSRILESVDEHVAFHANTPFDSNKFHIQLGFYKMDQDGTGEVMTDTNTKFVRHMGPVSHIEITKDTMTRKPEENDHELRIKNYFDIDMTIFENPIAVNIQPNVRLTYRPETSETIIPANNFTYRYQITDVQGRIVNTGNGYVSSSEGIFQIPAMANSGIYFLTAWFVIEGVPGEEKVAKKFVVSSADN